ncbi:MAG: hypothetical protein WA814_03750 [Candidatus Baltobacteraceae bacterium]
MWSRASLAFVCSIALVPGVARADAYGDLLKIKAAFDAATSFHAVMQVAAGPGIVVEHVAPDRWKIQPFPGVTAYIIGKDVTLESNGKKLPQTPAMQGSLHQLVDQIDSIDASDEVKSTAKDLGTQTLDGQSVHTYSFTSGPSQVTISVGSNMLPVQSIVTAQQGTITVKYTQFNDASIVIQP